jgi:hypothetical protein
VNERECMACGCLLVRNGEEWIFGRGLQRGLQIPADMQRVRNLRGRLICGRCWPKFAAVRDAACKGLTGKIGK